ISAGGVGSLVGATFAGRVVRRFGVGRSILVMMLASSAIGVLTPLASGPLFLATLMVFLPQLIGDGTNTIQWIAQDTVVQTAVPDRVLGRVNATLDVLSHGAAPFGALVAAAIAESSCTSSSRYSSACLSGIHSAAIAPMSCCAVLSSRSDRVTAGSRATSSALRTSSPKYSVSSPSAR